MDAFDRAVPALTGPEANLFNGGYWTSTGSDLAAGPLVPALSPAIANRDEAVELGGDAWRSWMQHWYERGGAVDVGHVMAALNDTLVEHNVNWCDRCELFALHSPGYPKEAPEVPDGDNYFPVARTFANRIGRWNACRRAEKDTARFVGPPPEAHLAMDAACSVCLPLHHPDENGLCAACPVGQVPFGLTCSPCPAGSIPGQDNECHACTGQNAVGADLMTCVLCPPGSAPSENHSQCELCRTDLLLNMTAEDRCNGSASVSTLDIEPSFVLDNCPDEFWVKVLTGPHQVTLTADTPNPTNEAVCEENHIEAVVESIGGEAQTSFVGQAGVWCEGVLPDGSVLICDDVCKASVALGTYPPAPVPFRAAVKLTSGYAGQAAILGGHVVRPADCPPTGPGGTGKRRKVRRNDCKVHA